MKRSLLTVRMQENHRESCRRLLNVLKIHGNRKVIFTDKTTKTVDPFMNKQNDCVVSFGQDASRVRYVSTTKHPASVMRLGVVASNGEKMPPLWFETVYRLTAADYKVILATKVLPWARKITKNVDCFQEKGE